MLSMLTKCLGDFKMPVGFLAQPQGEAAEERTKMATKEICVCELEQMDFSEPGMSSDEARAANTRAMNKIFSTGTMPNGEKVIVRGHWNEAGGTCCEHRYTCGFHRG